MTDDGAIRIWLISPQARPAIVAATMLVLLLMFFAFRLLNGEQE